MIAPFSGTVIAIAHVPEEAVAAGSALLVLEAMKMEHEVIAEADGIVRSVEVSVGDTVDEGQLLAVLAAAESATRPEQHVPEHDLDQLRDDLAAVRKRHEIGLDAARPDAVAKRRAIGHRTARTLLSSSTKARSSSTGR